MPQRHKSNSTEGKHWSMFLLLGSLCEVSLYTLIHTHMVLGLQVAEMN